MRGGPSEPFRGGVRCHAPTGLGKGGGCTWAVGPGCREGRRWRRERGGWSEGGWRWEGGVGRGASRVSEVLALGGGANEASEVFHFARDGG
ncbi:MAG: hypothetical protein RIS92_539 [Verrucomicrobiota bacterium]